MNHLFNMQVPTPSPSVQQMKRQALDNIEAHYVRLCGTPLDINEHLPTLYKYAMECESILETGVRGCISSWALVLGLLYNGSPKKKILLNDITPCNIASLLEQTRHLDITVDSIWINNLNLEIQENYDMVFIDTWHVYGQLKRELKKFSGRTNKYIIMHDTIVDEIYGETIRDGHNAEQQSRVSGIPVKEINRGLGPAITEFLEENKDWILLEKFTNNNGLTVLKRVGKM